MVVRVEARSWRPLDEAVVRTLAAYYRNVVVELPRPLADREVRDDFDGNLVQVFDGSDVRVPTTLPTGYELVNETELSGPIDAWTQVFAAEGRGGLQVVSGDHRLRDSYAHWLPLPTVRSSGVELRRDPHTRRGPHYRRAESEGAGRGGRRRQDAETTP